MQQETPQVSPPAPQVPPVISPPTPPASQPEDSGNSFYQPAAPASFAAPPADHAPLSSPYAAPVHNAGNPATLTWEASEYMHTDKGGMWLVGFGLIVAVGVGLAVWFSAWTFVVLILVMALAMGVFAFRPPHVLHYTLDENGVQIGNKVYHYRDFRAFGILEDGAFYTMNLIPVKRFAPALSVYFSDEQGDHIVDIVGEHLPMEDIQPDIIDNIMRRLHF